MLKKLRNTNEKGFTLIELMIVIAIIGILAAIAIPNFISYRDRSHCKHLEGAAFATAAAIGNWAGNPANIGVPTFEQLDGVQLNATYVASVVIQDEDPMLIVVTGTGENRCALTDGGGNTFTYPLGGTGGTFGGGGGEGGEGGEG